jgi:hypothetical protein
MGIPALFSSLIKKYNKVYVTTTATATSASALAA